MITENKRLIGPNGYAEISFNDNGKIGIFIGYKLITKHKKSCKAVIQMIFYRMYNI